VTRPVVPVRLAAAAALGLMILSGCADVPAGPAREGLITVTPTPIATPSSASEIRDQMMTAVHESQSVRVKGTLTRSGSSTVLDLTANRLGQTRGTVTRDGMTIDVVRDDQVIYVRAPDSYWAASQPALLPAASGKWVRAPLADSRFAELSSLLAFDQVVTAPLSNLNDVKLGSTTFFESDQVIEMSTATGSVFVQATGMPLPVAVVDSAVGVLRYTEWGAAVPQPTPSWVDVLDVFPRATTS